MHSNINRFIIVVLDSVGVGALPDAGQYGDEGANTLGHIFDAMGKDFSLPNLGSLGLNKIISQQKSICSASPLYSQRGDRGEFAVAVEERTPPCPSRPGGFTTLNTRGGINEISGKPLASFGKMACASPAKDTTAGHWELAGIILDKPFPVYPNGFPSDVIKEFEKKIGTKIIGNTTASGTEIISRLGDEHCRTGYPIVYTSADSVFQIAAHEQVFGLEKLYKICAIARQMLTGKHAVGRVIARPFTGTSGNYSRTLNRRDYSLTPSEPTILDRVKDIQGSVIGVGKIEDIFNKAGITKAIHTSSNREGFLATLELVKKQVSSGAEQRTIIFSNLVDFDMHWGHRRDTEAYAKGLKEFDNWLPELLAALKEEDVLIITADHGCDPTFKKHTDHTREYVPLIVCGKKINSGVDLGVRKSFADVAQTIADAFRLKPMTNGVSFARELGIS